MLDELEVKESALTKRPSGWGGNAHSPRAKNVRDYARPPRFHGAGTSSPCLPVGHERIRSNVTLGAKNDQRPNLLGVASSPRRCHRCA